MKKITLFCGALLASVMTLNATVLYEGEAKTIANWDVNLQVSNEELPNLEEGCLIAVTVSATAKDEENNHIPAISIQNGAWRDMNCGEYDIETGVHAFVLTKDQVDTIANTGGIIIRGSYYSYTKVELLYPDTLWTGTLSDNKGWEQSAELSKDLFTTIEEGSIVGVVVSAINDGATWHQYSIRGREDEDLDWEHLETILSQFASNVGTYLFVLTADQATSFREKNIGITAQYLDITALTTYVATRKTGPTTATENVQGNKVQGTKVLRNGQLLILRGGNVYTVNGQIVK